MASNALHFHLVNTLSQALTEIFEKQKYADKIIEKYFKANPKWGARDRRFFAEAVYEIVRHKRKLEFVAYSDDVWNVIAAYLVMANITLPKWKEFENLNVVDLQNKIKAAKPAEVEHSFPDWMNVLGQAEFGADWPALMKALNQPAEVYLRANELKISADELVGALAKEDIQAEKVKSKEFSVDTAVKLKIRKNVFITKAFKSGLFEMQDVASQFVAPLLEVQPGTRVVDACAGAGGKSLHIAALMKNKGELVSMDIHEWKLKELKGRAARNGVDIIETKVIDSNKTIKRSENSFDRVLLDVPCSGMGVLRRNPDTKWKLSDEEIGRLTELQKEILGQYSKMCKAGGIMVYATCSVLNRENEEQVKWFLTTEAGQQWNLKKELRVWPHKHGFDGFYAAVLQKK